MTRSRLPTATTHRIGVAGLDGSVRRSYGSGEPALLDGPVERAAFQQPQGMARWRSTLFVADTANHAIRRLDLESGMVTTIAGTGAQAPQVGGGPGRSTPLSSPGDVALGDGVL